jgi:hypothetical protein
MMSDLVLFGNLRCYQLMRFRRMVFRGLWGGGLEEGGEDVGGVLGIGTRGEVLGAMMEEFSG